MKDLSIILLVCGGSAMIGCSVFYGVCSHFDLAAGRNALFLQHEWLAAKLAVAGVVSLAVGMWLLRKDDK